MKQVYCLYRVSTVQQLREDDIPMQRQACREFAVTHQWGIIKDLYEKGISGFKTPINVYCGHCGGKILASTARKSHHPCAEVSERVPLYKCYNRAQYKGQCCGSTSHRAQKIDEYIQEELRQYFECY